ncbi:RAMP superfamily CRISPR-associated protein [Spirulina sp. CS-785/01]|uniref:RAMP superfamily CRISPR-associated protein n=1 Tax=Spirulina sp. CS-785/01 TaxID=3021716 RepID=UPI00232D29AB|nr:RAMP superfamily CRISPR-associated protein [Spirulina sp. CS-785/01]MDB9315009.1 RAMP superfamily CRISPR-associated protein [Spirulina sp. CS-785/01]
MTLAWLTCQEPVHIGGADSSSRGNNNPIYRLPDRSPAIPGSSLRGALREHAQTDPTYQPHVTQWFGGQHNNISPGSIGIGWGWPVWFPLHVLGYGNWWVSCPAWLTRVCQLDPSWTVNLDPTQVYSTCPDLNGQTVYLRWLKLTNVQHYSDSLPLPDSIHSKRCFIVPDEHINLMVDMGLVRQPRVSLKDEPDEKGNLVDNLFAVEGLPPGAAFLISWTQRDITPPTEEGDTPQTASDNSALDQWPNFLHQEHDLGGLWSVGYGRIKIAPFHN